jgi:hypothetical protein
MGLSLRLLDPSAGKADVPVAEGLHAALRLVYGEAAAHGVLDEIGALSQARRRALGVQLNTGKEAAAAAAALETYYAILCALARPFSSAVADDLGAAMPALPFGWKSGLEGATEVARSPRLTVERAAVLFNLAAAHCACGSLLPRTDAEQIKTAARHFQVAAGGLGQHPKIDLAAAARTARRRPPASSSSPAPAACSRLTPGLLNAALSLHPLPLAVRHNHPLRCRGPLSYWHLVLSYRRPRMTATSRPTRTHLRPASALSLLPSCILKTQPPCA